MNPAIAWILGFVLAWIANWPVALLAISFAGGSIFDGALALVFGRWLLAIWLIQLVIAMPLVLWLAPKKLRSRTKWGIAAFFLTLWALMALALIDKPREPCPECKEGMIKGAIVCIHCGFRVEG